MECAETLSTESSVILHRKFVTVLICKTVSFRLCMENDTFFHLQNKFPTWKTVNQKDGIIFVVD